MSPRSIGRLTRLAGAALAAALCAFLTGAPRAVAADLVPDFQLQDYNATSPTYLQFVSPRDFLGTTTAWYFGYAD